MPIEPPNFKTIYAFPHPLKLKAGLGIGAGKTNQGQKYNELFALDVGLSQDFLSLSDKSKSLEIVSGLEASAGIVPIWGQQGGFQTPPTPTRLNVRVGNVTGVQKNFFNDGSALRGDVVSGYDFGRASAYVGGRVSYTAYDDHGMGAGLFVQFDHDVTGQAKAGRFQAGVTFTLWPNKDHAFLEY